jgi:hypothetical protein
VAQAAELLGWRRFRLLQRRSRPRCERINSLTGPRALGNFARPLVRRQ